MNGEVTIKVRTGSQVQSYGINLDVPVNVDPSQQKMYCSWNYAPNFDCSTLQLLLDEIQSQGGLQVTCYSYTSGVLGNAFLTTGSNASANCNSANPQATIIYDAQQTTTQVAKTDALFFQVGSGFITTLMDLYPDETISQNWQFTDIGSFQARGSFSREFRVPLSDRNQEIFSMLSMNNFVDDSDLLNTKLPADIFVDDVPLISGFIRVIRMIRRNSTFVDIEVSFYGETPDLFTLIGQKKLNELTQLPTKNHELTQSYIDNQPDADILYSLIDRGTNNILAGAYGDSGAVAPDVTLDVQPTIIQQTPSLNWAWIFREIISDAGFQLDESFVSGGYEIMNILQQIWMPWIDVDPFVLPYDDYGVRGHIDQNETPASNWYSINDLNLFVDNASWTIDFDPTSSWIPVSNRIAISFDVAVYQFRVWATFDWASNSATTITLGIQTTATGFIFPITTDVASINIGANSIGTYYISGIVSVPYYPSTIGVVDYISASMVIKSTAAWDQTSTQIYAGNATNLEGTGIQLLRITPLPPSSLTTWQVNMKANAPDALQIDFVKDVVQMFNLAVVPDAVIPKKIKFVPLKSYIGSDGFENWSRKIAYDKDIVLRPAIDFLRKKVSFTYSVGGDMNSKFFESSLKRIYGDYIIDGYRINPDDTPNQFATGDTTIKLTTQSTPCSPYPTSQRVMPRFITNETDRVYTPPKMRALFYAGDYVNADGSVYRVLNHYSTIFPDVTDNDLNFAPETPLFPVAINPFNNLFTNYWQEYLNSLYDPQARIMEAFFALDFTDIKSFSFGKLYFIEDCYWRVLSISDYKVGKSELTKVSLLKVVNPRILCTLTPSGTAEDGSIIWVDVNNVQQDGTEICCRSYRYIWSSEKNKCFDKFPIDLGGGGNPRDIRTDLMFSGSQTTPVNSIGVVANSDGKIDTQNDFQIIVGKDITTKSDTSNSIVVGKELIVDDGAKNSEVLGWNTLALRTGVHFGGGKRNNAGNIGAMQSGKIVLSNASVFTFTNDQTELYFGVETMTRLLLENDTHWMVSIDMTATDFNGLWMSSKYAATIWNIGGTIGNSNPVQIMIDDSSGGGAWELKPAIDPVTSAPEFRIYARLLDLVPYLFPTPSLYVVATINYTQVR